MWPVVATMITMTAAHGVISTWGHLIRAVAVAKLLMPARRPHPAGGLMRVTVSGLPLDRFAQEAGAPRTGSWKTEAGMVDLDLEHRDPASDSSRRAPRGDRERFRYPARQPSPW